MKIVASALVALALAPASLAGNVLFDQLAHDQVASLWGSQLNADPQRNWRSFDNFTLGGDSQVTGVDWSGYLDFRGGETVELAPLTAITGFQITFYETDTQTGLPGAVISDQLIASALVTESNFGLPDSTYSAEISSVALQGGVNYWMSVAAVLPNPDGAVLIWRGGAGNAPLPGGDAQSAFDASVNGVDGFRPLDLLFQLRGVPTPGSAGLMALAGLAALRRRRA
ncbi:MAG: hypothetical protein SFZ24_01465 [Planctomycetota bacterium]|nr:hypothetical protein [Planctomycetota bacterium]